MFGKNVFGNVSSLRQGQINVVAGYSVSKKNSRVFYGERHDVFKTVGAKYSKYFGIFKSDQGNGFETFAAEIVNERGTDKFIFRKITGDPNVPAGKVSVKASKVPQNPDDVIDSKVQTR